MGIAATPARWAEHDFDVRALASRVVDPARDKPVVCVTTQPYLSRPMLDPDALGRALAGVAEVWVITRADHAWQLTEALPPGLDVYGGAIRVWWPITDPGRADPREHPTFSIWDPGEADRVTGEIVRELRRRLEPAPTIGAQYDATVRRVFAHGAEFDLDGVHLGFAANAHLANGPIYNAQEAVRPDMVLRVEVTGDRPPGRETYPVSLKPFAPDPWKRLAEVYRPGMNVEGVVTRLRDFGAFVELLPGAEGLLPNSRIAPGFVADPADHLDVDERVIVRLRTLEPHSKKAELSLIDVRVDDPVETPASLYPDGPSWLLAIDEPSPEDELPEEASSGLPEEAPISAASAVPTVELLSREGSRDESETLAVSEVQPTVLGLDAAEPALQEHAAEPPPAQPVDDPSQQLSEVIGAATHVHEQLHEAIAIAERDLVAVRSQARALIRELRDDIDAAELRVLTLARDETAATLGEARQEIGELREQVARLRDQLAAAERDRTELITQLRSAATNSAAQLELADRALADAEARARNLTEQLDQVDGGDPSRRLTREIYHAWSKLYTGEDRDRYPFREPIIGPALLDSIAATQGIARSRILDVCAHVACGRALLSAASVRDARAVERRDRRFQRLNVETLKGVACVPLPALAGW